MLRKNSASVGSHLATMLAMVQETSSQAIDALIEQLGDWRGAKLAGVRALIRQADPDVVEEWKWQKATSPGVPASSTPASTAESVARSTSTSTTSSMSMPSRR
jgi:hypothetical protein